jgi:hypothetical protein
LESKGFLEAPKRVETILKEPSVDTWLVLGTPESVDDWFEPWRLRNELKLFGELSIGTWLVLGTPESICFCDSDVRAPIERQTHIFGWV